MNDTLFVLLTVYVRVLAGEKCDEVTVWRAVLDKEDAGGGGSEAMDVLYGNRLSGNFTKQKLERIINEF